MKNIALAALFVVGCGGIEDISTADVATAYGAALTVDGAQLEAGMIGVIALQLSTASYATPGDAATWAGGANQFFEPDGCATNLVQRDKVTYTFTNCSGPYGLAKLNGTLTATFTSVANGQIGIALVSSGLKVNTVSVDVAASAVFAQSGSGGTTTVQSTTKAQNARGETATRAGQYTASWDVSCLSLDGNFMTSLGAVSWTTQVSGYRVCTGMCPDSSGKVAVSGPRGDTITVYYSGGATAEVITGTRTRGMIVLACGAT